MPTPKDTRTSPAHSTEQRRFTDYAAAGMGEALLPITPGSKAPTTLRSWPTHHATAEDHRRWDAAGYGVGIQGRDFPAIDIDVLDEAASDALIKLAHDVFGQNLIRYGRRPKALIPYRLADDEPPIPYMSVTFTLPSDADGATPHKIEVLGAGKQWVADAVHPETAKPYEWPDGSPAACGADALSALSADAARRFLEAAADMLQRDYGALTSTTGRKTPTVDEDDSDPAPSLDVAIEALWDIPNDGYHGPIDRDAWISVGYAFKGACGADAVDARAESAFIDWSEQFPSSEPGEAERVWRSLAASRSGWRKLRQAEKRADRIFTVVQNQLDGAELWTRSFIEDAGRWILYSALCSVGDTSERAEAVIKAWAASGQMSEEEARQALAECDGACPAASPLNAKALEELTREHALILIGGKATTVRWGYVDTGESSVYQPEYTGLEALRAFFENQKLRIGKKRVNPVDIWKGSSYRRSYTGVTFAPGRDTSLGGKMNLWCGWNVRPDPTGDWSKLAWHIVHIVCSGDKAAAHWLISWFAQIVQEPNRKPGTAVAVRGVKGAGKSIVGDSFRRLCPFNSLGISQPDQLTGKFNAHMTGKLFLQAEEAFWAADKRTTGALNDLITRASMTCEPKGVDAFQVPNYCRIYATSNADWVVPASCDERRWAVFNASSAHAQDHAYFKAIADQLENDGGYGRFLYDLLHWDLSGVNLRQPPQTTGLLEQKIMSLRDVERWWYEALSAGALDSSDANWGENAGTWQTQRLYQAYELWHRHSKTERGAPLPNNIFGGRLKGLGGSPRRHVKVDATMTGDERTRPGYAFGSLQEARVAFAARLGTTADLIWDDETHTGDAGV